MSNEERNIGGYLFKRYRADPDEHDWEARAEAAEAEREEWHVTVSSLEADRVQWRERAEAAEAERDVACEHSHELSVKYTVALNREREMREALQKIAAMPAPFHEQDQARNFREAHGIARAALASQQKDKTDG